MMEKKTKYDGFNIVSRQEIKRIDSGKSYSYLSEIVLTLQWVPKSYKPNYGLFGEEIYDGELVREIYLRQNGVIGTDNEVLEFFLKVLHEELKYVVDNIVNSKKDCFN